MAFLCYYFDQSIYCLSEVSAAAQALAPLKGCFEESPFVHKLSLWKRLKPYNLGFHISTYFLNTYEQMYPKRLRYSNLDELETLSTLEFFFP